LVGAALGDELELAAASGIVAGGLAGLDATEFLDRVDGGVAVDGAELAGAAGIDIEAVEGDVSLSGAGAGDRAIPGVGVVGDAGLHDEEGEGGVTNLHGQLVH